MSDSVNKIIFLLEHPLDKRYYNLLGIETLIRNGFEVDIWDLTSFIHKEITEKIDPEDLVMYNKCKKFDNKRDIVHELSKIPPDTIVNSIIAYQIQTFFIYHFLSTHRIKYCVLQMISFPPVAAASGGASPRLYRSFIKWIISEPVHVIRGLRDKILKKYYFLFGIRPADLALLSGERSLEIIRDPIDETTRLIWGHLWDYDIYLEEISNKITPYLTLGVFLDEYFPLHKDMEYLGITSPIEPDEYYAKLCSFFDHLEKSYNVRIVIAAHPQSDYSKTPHYFGGRPVIKGQTARLVHESSFVLAHDSTSINYAVLFRKPIMFITMDKMQNCDAWRLTVGPSIDAIASSLRKKPINLDAMSAFDWDTELRVDLPSYTKYQNDIIKKAGSPDIPLWEIYSQSIRQFFP